MTYVRIGLARICLSLVLLIGSALALPLSAQAQAPATASRGYPVKPIRLIMPFAAGGTGIVGRWVAEKLSEALGQNVIVDPRPGAGGNIGYEAGAKAPPDGYTLVLVNSTLSLSQSLYSKLAYDPVRDFAPISLLGRIPNVLVVHASVPARANQWGQTL